ncbi:hypothetical protein KP509_04G081900 [Ceratopteris richardii]|nr:hypothetical protein KP509_04G081900 [Ceratopteris richardii]
MDLQNDDGHEDFTSPHARGNDVSTQSHHQLGKFAREAFQLLQRNPKVQDAVKSLACDPAVWRAVMNNEKVLELAQEAQSTEASGDEHIVREKDIEMFASKFYGFVTRRTTGYYEYIKESLFSILQNMFGFIGKPEGMKGNNSSKDKTVTSCMMLAVAVVIVVVVGRHSKRHYK